MLCALVCDQNKNFLGFKTVSKGRVNAMCGDNSKKTMLSLTGCGDGQRKELVVISVFIFHFY